MKGVKLAARFPCTSFIAKETEKKKSQAKRPLRNIDAQTGVTAASAHEVTPLREFFIRRMHFIKNAFQKCTNSTLLCAFFPCPKRDTQRLPFFHRFPRNKYVC